MNSFIDSAKIMSKGQVTIPKDIRTILGVSAGDRLTFIVENDTVRVVNAAAYAMKKIQSQMSGEAEKAGLASEEDIMDMIYEIRHEPESAE